MMLKVTPVKGMQAGILLGLAVGLAAVDYLNLHSLIEQVCAVGALVMVFQLAGATMASLLAGPPA